MNNNWIDHIANPPEWAEPIWIATTTKWGAVNVWAGYYCDTFDEWYTESNMALYPEDYTILGWQRREPQEVPKWE